MGSHVAGVTTAQAKRDQVWAAGDSYLHVFDKARSRPCVPPLPETLGRNADKAGAPRLQADSFKLDDKPFV